MNSALLYRENGRRLFWIAFVSALAIHIGAVALAKTKSPIAKVENLITGTAVEILDVFEPEPAPPEESVRAPLEQIQPDQDSLPEENHTPPSVRAHQRSQPPSLVQRPPTTSWRSVAYAPCPVYPYEARRQRVTGSGVALLMIDRTSGTVTDVLMMRSCGNAILDNSTLDALRRWRFRPGTAARVQVPITYTLMGASY